MSESRVTPTIKTCDRAGDNIRGGWKSSAALADTYARGATHVEQVAIRSIECVISGQHTFIKMDIECSELGFLATSPCAGV